jgi:hypothetical protein
MELADGNRQDSKNIGFNLKFKRLIDNKILMHKLYINFQYFNIYNMGVGITSVTGM